jgi:hypothetical protein
MGLEDGWKRPHARLPQRHRDDLEPVFHDTSLPCGKWKEAVWSTSIGCLSSGPQELSAPNP